MSTKTVLMATAASLLGTSAYAVPTVTHLGSISTNKPAFLGIERLVDGENPSLVVTSFGFTGNDTISVIRDLPTVIRGVSTAKTETLTTSVVWPNQARVVPAEIFAFNAMVAVGGFFPIPWKSTGSVNIINLDNNNQTVQISRDKKGWWYHNAIWRDMNGDGRLDILTARARKGMFGGGGGELLWLEQPASNALGGYWQEHVLTEGPDVYFALEDLDGDGIEEIIATEFNAKRLTMYTQGTDGKLKRTIIDANVGSAFAVTVVDLNRDGSKELLVTNHENRSDESAVFAYEIPNNIEDGDWTRHTLLTGLITQGGVGQASPGHALPIHPNTEHAATEAPWIVVSGDGSREAYLLKPNPTEDNPWAYSSDTILKTGGIVGKPAFADVDGDGNTELFIPAYDDNRIHVFTFAP